MGNGKNKNHFERGEKKMEETKKENQEVFEQMSLNLEPEVTETEPEVTETEPEEESEEESNLTTGKLDNCARLYVRKEADKESDPVTTIDDQAIILINLKESTDYFYKVEVQGLVGYCMKKFIKID